MISLPPGKPVERGVAIGDVDVLATFENLNSAALNGYFTLMVDGFGGIEEGIVAFKEGLPVAAGYEYLKFDQTILSEQALSRIFNAGNAKFGVFDVYSLSKEQVDLVLAFNGQAVLKKLPKKQDLASLASQHTTFSPDYAKQDVGIRGREGESKEEVLKRYMLADLVGPSASKEPQQK